MLFDIAKLVKRIKEVAEEIQATKKLARTHRHPDQWKSQCLLPGMKYQATLLCSLRAHTRQRVHLQGSTLEAQEELVKGLYAEFETQEPLTALPVGVIERVPAIAEAGQPRKSLWRAARRLLGAA